MTARQTPPPRERPILQDVSCPCCGGTFPRFLPFGVQERPNAKCPGCGSKKRHRLLWLFLRDRTNLFRERLRVLHFAPERCLRTPLALLSNLQYVTADLEPGKVDLVMDITAIPPAAGTFDAILCSHVLEHVSDDQQAMREMFRVLRPGGWLVLMVPVDWGRERTLEDPRVVSPQQREEVFGQHDHVRVYGHDVAQRLESAGFAVRVHQYAQELGPEAVRKYALKRRDEIYFCTKPSTDSG